METNFSVIIIDPISVLIMWNILALAKRVSLLQNFLFLKVLIHKLNTLLHISQITGICSIKPRLLLKDKYFFGKILFDKKSSDIVVAGFNMD